MSKEEQEQFKEMKKDVTEAIKSLTVDDEFVLLIKKDGENRFEQWSGCKDDMVIARFIRDTLDESEAMRTLVKYLELKDRENRPSFHDMLAQMAGLDNDDE